MTQQSHCCQRACRHLVRVIVLATLAVLIAGAPAQADSQVELSGPAGSGAFGTGVTVLPNGNLIVTDPSFDAPGPVADVGAIYLYSGTTGALISTLIGSTASDQVGSTGLTVLANGNFLVRSANWDAPGSIANAGAITWCSATGGCDGAVSSANSLVGSTAGDQVGSTAPILLANGNYVTANPNWDAPGPITNAGALTWCSSTAACTGVISSANSLVGSSASDQVGANGIVSLANGNFVVRTNTWDAPGSIANAGAVTWCSDTAPCTGVISGANSLVGSTAGDGVGNVSTLSNGHYVVTSSLWDAPGAIDVGAATWCNGSSGCVGTVSITNSLVGSTANDGVGGSGAIRLANGHYVLQTSSWDAPGPVANVGAITWCNGTSGCTGTVSITNSLVGSTANDSGGDGVALATLSNGNYVASYPSWDAPGPVVNVGAVTWCSGTGGCTGAITSTISLIGSTANDQIGSDGLRALTNGNYLVLSSIWDAPGPIENAGAVTWCNGASGCSGTISSANSLIGSGYDFVGDTQFLGSVSTLANGNYLVNTPHHGADIGASTLCNGTSGCTGTISTTNSLVGSTAGDQVGATSVLANGDYLAISTLWDNGAVADAGAVTWCSGATGCTGTVTTTNSLVGTTANDKVGSGGVFGTAITQLGNGNYIVRTKDWDAPGPIADVGAVTWCAGGGPCTGSVSAVNSLIGSTAGDQVGNDGFGGQVTVLPNGNYVVRSNGWDNGAATNAGAATWCSGTSGCAGAVSASNSLVGSTTNDQAGGVNLSLLGNGHYVVWFPNWDGPGPIVDAGSVTWCSGTGGCVGTISSANSLVGSTASDHVGIQAGGIVTLTNGSYVVRSPNWDAPGPVADVGAATWCPGTGGCIGAVTDVNSLVGSTANDQVGNSVNQHSPTNSYLVRSPSWDAPGPVANSGAVAWCSAIAGCIGPVSAINSVLGTASGGGGLMATAFDGLNDRLVVGRRSDNAVSFRLDLDNDFVRNAIEDAAPNGGDANADGLPDDHQPNVASLPNAANGDYATLIAPANMAFTNVMSRPNPSPGDSPAGIVFAAGFFDFQLFPMPAPPMSTTVQLKFQNPITATEQYWLYGSEPPPGSALDHWHRFDPLGGSPPTGAANLSTTRWDLSLVDGARGDDDLAVNKTVAALGGPGLSVIPPGDCNGSSLVDVADVSGLVLEIFDGDGTAPASVPGGTFPGLPIGCNANGDGVVDAGDLSCTIRLIFNGPGACVP